MKRWIAWLLRSKNRRLEVSVGGRWYLGFTVLLGVVAINSGNNVIYLLESLLLSALILSGVLSERTLTRVSVERIAGRARAGAAPEDVLIVRNRGFLPLYCLEICEWRGDEVEVLAFLLALPGRAEVRVRSRQVLGERGRRSWNGLALATSFPFGFARKIRLLPAAGARIVWPAVSAAASDARREYARAGTPEVSPGEIEEIAPWDDVSRVHWPSSARAGRLLARPRRMLQEESEVLLELCPPGEELERRIRKASGAVERGCGRLVLSVDGRRTEVPGKTRALDALALLPKAGGDA